MVYLCAVPGCGNESGQTDNLHMHGFPFPNAELIEEWMRVICRLDWCPKKNSKICSDHFVADDYISNYSHRLKPTAIPSRSLPVVVECCHEEETPNLGDTMNNTMDVTQTMNPGVMPMRHIFASDDKKHAIPMPIHMGFKKRPRVATLAEILSQASTSRQKVQEQDIDIETELPMSTIFYKTKTKNSFKPAPPTNCRSSISECNNVSLPQATVSKKTEQEDKDFELLAVKLINLCIEKNPKMYVGVHKVWHKNGFVDLLSKKSNLPIRDLNLALMKLRLNDSFERLGHTFGMSETKANTIFNNCMNYLGIFLQLMIRWPGEAAVMKLLPVPFRRKFSNVKSVINCLELEICKPTSEKQHLLTWSKGKKCNTLKYLVASTPDGFIYFVSKGFGGSLTDTEIVAQNPHCIELLPDGCAILTEKRFENILTVIQNKSCELIILPSVTTGMNSTREERLLYKSIVSLRVHFDRVLEQMREYEILKVGSVLDSNLVPNVDGVVVIIAALINLQSTLIEE